MTNEEIKKIIKEIEARRRFPDILDQDGQWCFIQLRASIEREESLAELYRQKLLNITFILKELDDLGEKFTTCENVLTSEIAELEKERDEYRRVLLGYRDCDDLSGELSADQILDKYSKGRK
jgi:hypothetical protein